MKRFLPFFLAFFTVLGLNAQSYYYIPHLNAGQNPGNLNQDGEYPNGQGLPLGWTSLLGTSPTPQWTAVQTIPFTFNFNGQPVTQYKVSTTGILTFDVTAATPPASTPSTLPNNAIPNKSVVIWGIEGTGSNDFIVSKTFGTAPNRQHWVFFASYSAAGSTVGWTYWSIVLEETTDKIYIVDQRTANTTTSLTLGLQIDPATALMVNGSPNITAQAGNSASPNDNSYYEFIYGNQPDYDLALSSIQVGNGDGLAPLNQNNNITGTIQNNGAQTITSLDVNYKIDNGMTVVDHKTGLSIASGNTYNFTHSTPWVPTSGGGQIKTVDVWVSNPNGNADQNPGNDSAQTSALVNLGISGTKYVLLEEFTTVPCGFCPDGMLVVEDILNTYDNVIATGVHAGFGTDAMTNTHASALAAAFTNGAPTAVIDRTYYEGESNVAISRNIWADKVSQRLNEWTPVNVKVNGSYDPGTHTINATVSADFVDYAAPGNIRIGLQVIEDSVTGTGAGYDQHSYYYNATGHPFYHVGVWNGNYATIPGYIHKHVLRDASPNIWGAPGVISNPQPNDHFTRNASVVLDTTWDEDQVYLIGFVAYYDANNVAKRQVLNSFQVKLSELGGVGLNPVVLQKSVLYPNPTADMAVLSLFLNEKADVSVFLTDLSGKLVKNIVRQAYARGEHSIGIFTGDLPDGIYLVNVRTGDYSIMKKLVVAH